MQYIFRSDSIDVLQLPKRINNCAHRVGAHTIGDFLTKSAEEWMNTKNIGKQALDEILRITKEILDGTGEFILSDANRESIPAGNTDEVFIDPATFNFVANTIYIDNNGKVIRDIDVEVIAPSPSACQSLKEAGYYFASQLIGMSNESISKLHHISIKTKKEIRQIISNLAVETISISPTENNANNSKHCDIVEELCNTFGNSSDFWTREIFAVKTKHLDIDKESLIYQLYNGETVRNILQEFILERIEAEDRLSRIFLNQMMPKHLSNTSIVEELLFELEKQEKIICSENEIIRIYPSIMKYVDLIEDEIKRTILTDRLNGKTLDAIGAEYQKTRERVRQISEFEFRRICKLYRQPKFYEDKYLPIYSKYQLYAKDFVSAFDEPLSTFLYLDWVDNKKFEEKLPIESILTDNTISRDVRKKAEKIIYKNYITDNGIRVKIDRPILVKHYIKQYCKALTEYDKFQDSYNQWVGKYDIINCDLNSRAYENKITECEYALWNRGRRFRYYNIFERDYTELLEMLDLDQYTNIEMSTAKWMREFPEVMQSYDIRDEYELHNLLKKLKIAGIIQNNIIAFGKMPTIIFGNSNKQNQIFELIVQYAPLSAEDLSQKYEDLYGVRADSLRGSPDFKTMDIYFEKGMYRIDHPSMSSEQVKQMTNCLVNDYYSLEEIKLIFKRSFPDSDIKLINTYSIKSLGFHVYSAGNGYVIKNTYQNASRYFKFLLTKDPVFDTRNFPQSMRNLLSYTKELYELRNNYEIIEFAPSQYINISRLNDLDISKKLLWDYCKEIERRTEIGEYFTIKSLRDNGFTHSLDDIGFDEWFYSSIIATHMQSFSFAKIGGTRLFLRDTNEQKCSCSLEGLLKHILNSFKKIDFFDLSDYLINKFGIKLQKEKIKEAIRESDLYYDSIMDTVYIDYDTYFEEI